MAGGWNQIPIALGLGMYHHTDLEFTLPGNITVRFDVGPPVGFYGHVLAGVIMGDMLSNVCTVQVSHKGYASGLKQLHSGYWDEASSPFSWIDPNYHMYVEVTNLLAVPIHVQWTFLEIYFTTKGLMEVAKLAFWEYMAPFTYNLAVKKGLIAPIMEVRELPIRAISPTAPTGIPT